MIVEAMRAFLSECGVEGVEKWTRLQIIEHVEQYLTQKVQEPPEKFEDLLSWMLTELQNKMLIIRDTLNEDPR